MTGTEPWTERAIAEGGWIRQDFGKLSAVVANVQQEWRVATFAEGAPEEIGRSGSVADLPPDLAWERWDRDPRDRRVGFRPAFPLLPVVARPSNVLHLAPGRESSFFLGIPAWLEVLGERQQRMTTLMTLPCETLSKTWHGTPLAGKAGYALRTYARRSFFPEEWPENDIVCALSIVNEGSKSLLFERLYLETQHLSVFMKDGRYWSNAVRLRTNPEENNLSNMTFATRPAVPNDDAVEVTPPRLGRRRRTIIHSAFAKVLGQLNPLEDP